MHMLARSVNAGAIPRSTHSLHGGSQRSFSACHLGERERQQGLALAAPRKGHGGGHNELGGVRDQPRQQARRFHEERHIQGRKLVVGNKFKRVQHQAATAF